MDQFIYDIPDYTFDWSKYIYKIPNKIDPQTELFTFLNITNQLPTPKPSFQPSDIIINQTNNTVPLNTTTNSTKSKFAKTVRSKHSY